MDLLALSNSAANFLLYFIMSSQVIIIVIMSSQVIIIVIMSSQVMIIDHCHHVLPGDNHCHHVLPGDHWSSQSYPLSLIGDHLLIMSSSYHIMSSQVIIMVIMSFISDHLHIKVRGPWMWIWRMLSIAVIMMAKNWAEYLQFRNTIRKMLGLPQKARSGKKIDVEAKKLEVVKAINQKK